MTKTQRKTKKIDKPSDRISIQEMAMCWAEDCSYRSTCDRLSVGALIFSSDMRRVLGYGYNGNYSGGPNKCDSKEPGNCGCIHAEMNALISCNREKGMVMFVTFAPCLNCAKCILNAGIEIVYYARDYRKSDGLKLLRSKIKVIHDYEDISKTK